MADGAINITESDSIEKCVRQCLQRLSEHDGSVTISSTGKSSAKAITVAEIIKRRVSEAGDKWYQYTSVETKSENYKGQEDESDKEFEVLRIERRFTKPVITIQIRRQVAPELEHLGFQSNDIST